MKLKDLAFIGAVVLLLAPFFLSNDLYAAYLACNASHPYLMALLKFGILSTAGEVIGLRIKTGRYNEPGFGILNQAVVWGILGVWLAAMMKPLSLGVPAVAESFGIEGVAAAMMGALTPLKFIGAQQQGGIAHWASKLWISEDTCKTWTEVIVPDELKDVHPNGVGKGVWFQSVEVDPSNRDMIY